MHKNRGRCAGIKLVAFIACMLIWVEFASAADSGTLYGVRAAQQKLTFRSIDLGSLQPAQDKGSLAQGAQERLAAIFQNSDRSIGLVRISTNELTPRKALVRMAGIPGVLVDASSSQIAGLASAYAISSLLVPSSGTPLALISHYTDTPRYWLVRVDLAYGGVSALNIALHPAVRYAHMTQCSNGRIYAISMAAQGEVRLVEFDLKKLVVVRLAQLQIGDEPMREDVSDLACGGGDQLYALSDIQRPGNNSVFRIDLPSGGMTWVRDFDVDRFVFVR
ncbi:MAG: hypothetical protein ABI612_24065 [Betaproteobacteria bacterium]